MFIPHTGINMTPEYLAGFFDGEGCIDVQTKHISNARYNDRFYCRPRVRVSQAVSGKCIIDALSTQFGGHVASREHSGRAQQDSLSWEFLGKERMIDFLNLMLPHLIVKKEQAVLCVWWLENMSSVRSDVSPNIGSARKCFAEELKLMKADPQRLSEEAVRRIKALMR
jgi:hypothetical protein